MSRLDKPTDFSALLEKYADSPPIPRSGWNTDRERSNSRPYRHDVIRERLSNRFRSAYHDRTRTYALRDSEIFTLGELGKFRVISADDLSRFAYDGNRERLEQDIQHLKKQALVSQREIEAQNSPKFRVFRLTRDGKRFLRQQNRVRKSQALYDGFLKPKELKAFSSDLVVDIGYEIRDVMPDAESVLYAFIGESQTIPADELNSLLTKGGIKTEKIPEIISLLLWYGVLGVRRLDGSVTYIYDVNYDMPILKGIIRKIEENGLVFVVNPAFVQGLQIREN
jgi:hypothetical protein